MFLKIGHRGAKGLVIENTLESFKKAIEFDVNAIEFDVRKTKDNALIVIHDENLKRIWNKNILVKNCELRTIKEISNDKIPTLEEALDFLDKKVEKILIEIKEAGAENLIYETVKNFKLINRVIFISFLEEVLINLRKIDKKIDLGLIYVKYKNPIEFIKSLNAVYLLPFYKFVHTKEIENAHKNKVKLLVWTINNENEIKSYYQKGVDGIASDFPNLFKVLDIKNSSTKVG
jgi:glycerophosphoryl diester phosphodiesterase